jgi:hypothetical protein
VFGTEDLFCGHFIMSMREPDNEVLDPVTIGDLIVLNATEPKDCVGALRGDSANFTVGIQLPNAQNKKRDSLQFDDYVFRVCPSLNYRQRNELDVYEMKTNGPPAKGSGPKLKRKLSIGMYKIKSIFTSTTHTQFSHLS